MAQVDEDPTGGKRVSTGSTSRFGSLTALSFKGMGGIHGSVAGMQGKFFNTFVVVHLRSGGKGYHSLEVASHVLEGLCYG